ncbi:ABC transporter permease subunit [Bacillus sp. 165]|uniref:ABC transporter permease n=1 Tax=Bacillus sp. 165 TaxID=1529117 RepID=UPI001ADA8BDF|nr:ABC transporter permease subunit [Bacillus sp. 165]MBO9129377.1 ABC transporter permease subunit [Bacillus sp. 165]
MGNIWRSEWRMTIRQRSSYTFVLLWVSILSLLFLLERNTPSLTGYTNMTGTIANLVIYIVPLFMLIIGSFSVANEMENGQWRLLSTYPISSFTYVTGKLAGQFTAQATIFTLSFGISLMIGLLSGSALSVKWVCALYLFAVALMFFFLTIGLVIGAFVTTRWQALTISVGIWFFLIMIWPSALIAILGLVPYPMIGLLLKMALLLNPAELLRIVFVVQLGGGAVFGQAYDSLVTFLQTGVSWGVLALYMVVYTGCSLMLSTWNLERRKMQ